MRNWNLHQSRHHSGNRHGVSSVPMRNWNPPFPRFLTTSTEFLAYLWGIETQNWKALYEWMDMFLAYLWGIETWIPWTPVMMLPMFLAYLWGIETWFSLTHHPRRCHVSSVPMRNWNWSSSLGIYPPILHVSSVPMRNWNPHRREYMMTKIAVSSVPMRNWNNKMYMEHIPMSMFLAYLWGIETRRQKGRSSLLPWFLAYLWGIETNDGRWSYRTRCHVSSVPMRNWNRGVLGFPELIQPSF